MRRLALPLTVLAVSACGGGPAVDPEPAATEVPMETRGSELTLLVEAPVDEVFRLWSTVEGAQSFFAPAANIGSAVGGPYEIIFEPRNDPEGAHHGTRGAKLRVLEPGARISFGWSFPPFGPEFASQPLPTWVEVTVEPFSANPELTLLHFAHRGFPVDPSWDEVYRIFADGNWPLVLNRLLVFCRDGVSPDWSGEGDSLSDFLLKKRTIPAPIAEVWAAWSTQDGLSAFLDTPVKMELIAGGPYEVYFLPDAPQGQRGGEGNFVVAFEAERFITFTWNAPPQFPAVRQQHHIVSVQLEPNGDQTDVRLTAVGFGTGEEWTQTHQYFDRAWDLVLDELTTHLAPEPGTE